MIIAWFRAPSANELGFRDRRVLTNQEERKGSDGRISHSYSLDIGIFPTYRSSTLSGDVRCRLRVKTSSGTRLLDARPSNVVVFPRQWTFISLIYSRGNLSCFQNLEAVRSMVDKEFLDVDMPNRPFSVGAVIPHPDKSIISRNEGGCLPTMFFILLFFICNLQTSNSQPQCCR